MADPRAAADTLDARATKIHTPVGDGALVWRLWGPETALPLILLHGGSGSWNHWVRNIDTLVAAQRRVIIPDIPGFGESSAAPDGHDADVLPGWLEAGARIVLGERPVDVVGFSFGGLVAGLWAAAHGGRFSKLVLVGAPTLMGKTMPVPPMRSLSTASSGAERDAVHRHNLQQMMLARQSSVDALAVHLHGQNVVRDRMRKRRMMHSNILRELMPTITCPVAAIYGEEDVLFRDNLDRIQGCLATAPAFTSMTRIAGAGHWVQYEETAAFNHALLAHLDNALARTTARR